MKSIAGRAHHRPSEQYACFRVDDTSQRLALLTPRTQWYRARGVSDVTEAFGFHGTSPSAVASILSFGFRPVSVRNGSSCGEGIYLASTSNLRMALNQRYAREEAGIRCVLVCRFIKGCSAETSARDKTTDPRTALTGGNASRGIHVVWWPNANTDIVVTHVICLGAAVDRRERAEKELHSLGYSLGQDLLITAPSSQNSSASPRNHMTSGPSTNAKLYKRTIRRINSSGCVVLSYHDKPDVLLQEQVSVSQMRSRHMAAAQLLSEASEATSLSETGMGTFGSHLSLSELAYKSNLQVLMPGHMHVIYVGIVEIDLKKSLVVTREWRDAMNRVTAGPMPSPPRRRRRLPRQVDSRELRASVGTFFGGASECKTFCDRTWTLPELQKNRYIAQKLVDASAIKVLGIHEKDVFEPPPLQWHKARIACLRTCEPALFDVSCLQEGQIVDAVDARGCWYHATILRIVPVDFDSENLVQLVQLTYRVYHPSGEYETEQDGARFTGFKRAHDEWHLAVPSSIAAFGTRSSQPIIADMLCCESNEEAQFVQRLQKCTKNCEREETELDRMESQLRMSTTSSSAVPSAQEILDAARAKRVLELSREKAMEAQKAVVHAQHALNAHYSTTAVSRVEEKHGNEPAAGHQPVEDDEDDFECRIALATNLSLQDVSAKVSELEGNSGSNCGASEVEQSPPKRRRISVI